MFHDTSGLFVYRPLVYIGAGDTSKTRFSVVPPPLRRRGREDYDSWTQKRPESWRKETGCPAVIQSYTDLIGCGRKLFGDRTGTAPNYV